MTDMVTVNNDMSNKEVLQARISYVIDTYLQNNINTKMNGTKTIYSR